MTVEQMTEFFKEAYSDVELDEPTEEEWDRHTLAGLKDADMDSFAATPELEF